MSHPGRLQNDQFFKNNKNLDEVALKFIRQAELANFERAQTVAKKQRLGRYIGLALGGMVISIYVYTIRAVKQETFLDNFDEPETID